MRTVLYVTAHILLVSSIRTRWVQTKAPPSGPDWPHEIKHDSFRIVARRDAKGV
jgi:hypothetical protein